MMRSGLAALAAAATLLLAGCFLSPGKFDSTLNLHRNGQFTFTYTGEIYVLALSRLADMANKTEFTPEDCHDDDFKKRPCTPAELAEQRRTWDAGKEQREKDAKQQSEAMRALLGGIDPSDPRAAEELAERLRRQAGWRRVDYRGNGLFDVDFSITSEIGHDFIFPTIEQFSMANYFVAAHVRQGGQVRIEAPGFSTATTTGNPYQAMLAEMASGGGKNGKAESLPAMPTLDGIFRVVTDGRILANNTDEGPKAGPGGQVLSWRINQRTPSAPMALVDLAP